jgi:acetyl-CoA carboxylase biotin carboxyl carrier protein
MSVHPPNAEGASRRSTVDLKDIKAIIDLMRKNAISEFELERQDFKIRLKRGVNGGSTVVYDDTVLHAGGALAPMLPASAAPAKIPEPAPATLEVKSPMIGTFYRSPSPDANPYIDIGSEVGPETVVCIIEAMKVMNEIKAETRGIVAQILVDNAKPVEFGQPLFKLRPL